MSWLAQQRVVGGVHLAKSTFAWIAVIIYVDSLGCLGLSKPKA